MTLAKTLNVPDNWHGSMPHSSSAVSKYPFTCVGAKCWSATPINWDGKTVTHPAWKCSNSLRTPYRDNKISDNSQWQGMCKECSDSRSGVRTTVLIEAVRQRQHQAQSLPQHPPLKTADESEIIDAVGVNVDVDVDTNAAAIELDHGIVDNYGGMDNYDIGGIGEGEGEEWEGETDLLNLPPHPPGEGEGEECEGETDELLNLPPHPPEKSYCTHDMAKKLGKIMWDDIALIVPRIQQNGYLNEPRQKGQSSTVASSQTSNALAIKFDKDFPNAPLVNPKRAELRALAMKDGIAWTEASKERAMLCFVAEAAGMQIVLHMPELVGRKELLADQRYCTPDGGCLCICPSCETNKFVKPNGINASNSFTKLRFAWGIDGCYLVIYSEYRCSNPECPAVMEKSNMKNPDINAANSNSNNNNREISVTFTAIDPKLTNHLYPESYRCRFFVELFDGRQGGLDKALAAKLFRSTADIKEMARDLMTGRQAKEEFLLSRYLTFVNNEVDEAKQSRRLTSLEKFVGCTLSIQSDIDDIWPEYTFQHPTDSLVHMTSSNITTAFHGLHKQLHPWLMGDLLRRAPGSFASSDATFRLAIRSRDNTGAGCLVFVIGERGDIIAWYALKSESWEEMRAGLIRLRDRLQRLGVLNKLRYWYDDRCCNRCKPENIYDHIVVDIFEGIVRCPLKDKFHGSNLVNKTLVDGTGDKEGFSKLVAGIICKPHEPDIEAVIQYLMKKNPQLGKARATMEAKKSYRREGIIRTKGESSEIMLTNWMELIEYAKALARKAKKDNTRCCIRPSSLKSKGTIEEMEDLIPCFKKGCFSDPLSVQDMWIPISKQRDTGLITHRQKGGTSKNEGFHMRANQIIEHVGHIGTPLLGIRISWLIYIHNEGIDRSLGLSDRHAVGCFQWIMHALNLKATNLRSQPYPSLVETLFTSPYSLPPLLPIDENDVNYEPMGFQYIQHEKRVRDERVRNEAMQGVASTNPTSSSASSQRQGGKHWNATPKRIKPTVAHLPAIIPTHQSEVNTMMLAYAEAQKDVNQRKKKVGDIYEHTADIYFRETYKMHIGPGDPPKHHDHRPNPTSGTIVKNLLDEALLRGKSAINSEQELMTSLVTEEVNEVDASTTNVVPMTAEADTTIPVVKTADREEITNKMQPDNVISENVSVKSEELSLEELRLLSRKRKRAKSDRRRAQAVNDTFQESIPTLTLDMCRDLSIPLTQVVLRAYCKSAGLNQRGSPKELRERLDKAMMGENVTDLSTYIDLMKKSI